MSMFWRISLTLTGLTVALLILVVSLTAVNVVQSAETRLSKRHFYLSGRVLPDHTAYPVLMALDRLRLETASPLEQIFLRVDYANRRFEYVLELLEKDQASLALTTMTKAQKYLIQAAHEAIEQEQPASVRHYIASTMSFHVLHSAKLADRFDDQDRHELFKLNDELVVMLEKLNQ